MIGMIHQVVQAKETRGVQPITRTWPLARANRHGALLVQSDSQGCSPTLALGLKNSFHIGFYNVWEFSNTGARVGDFI